MKNLRKLDQNWIKKFKKPFIIAGPCSAESEDQILKTIKDLDKSYISMFRAGIWKPRTRPGAFEGIGEIGLQWLKKLKKLYNIPVATEIANANHAKLALEYDIDCLWIGARSTVNPFTVQEIAESINNTEKIVLVKNPVNPDLDLWIGALERLLSQGVKNIGVIHRGFSVYNKSNYRNNPEWDIILKFRDQYPNIPIITDPSHICGNRNGIFNIAKQALNYDFSGLMIETHYDPDNALSDSFQQVTPNNLLKILKKLEKEINYQNKELIFKSKLNLFRNQIDNLDQQILNIIFNRFKIAKSIGKLKKDNNVDILQSKRWNEILQDIKIQSAKLNLREDFIEKLFLIIHMESIEIQDQI